MREIKLTRGYVALVDDSDYEWLSRWKWYAHVKQGGVYAVRQERVAGDLRRQRTVQMHCVIANPPDGMEVDHIDRNKLNNTRDNLRIATHQQNSFNSTKGNMKKTSRFKGVHWLGRLNKWQAEIAVNGKKKYLGVFLSEEEAARTYDQAARIHHGEFARLNFKQKAAMLQSDGVVGK